MVLVISPPANVMILFQLHGHLILMELRECIVNAMFEDSIWMPSNASHLHDHLN